MKLDALPVVVVLLTRFTATGGSLGEVGFSRIIHGWTNYSTGFTCTHDTDPDGGDFATLHQPIASELLCIRTSATGVF